MSIVLKMLEHRLLVLERQCTLETGPSPTEHNVLLHWSKPSSICKARHYTALLGGEHHVVHIDSLAGIEVFWSWEQCTHKLRQLAFDAEDVVLYYISRSCEQ